VPLERRDRRGHKGPRDHRDRKDRKDQQVSNRRSTPDNMGTGSAFSIEAECPPGTKVLGGGIRLRGLVALLTDLRVFESVPSSPTAWRAGCHLVVRFAVLTGSDAERDSAGPPFPPFACLETRNPVAEIRLLQLRQERRKDDV